MKNKKLLFALFAIAILAVPIYIATSSEDILSQGKFYKFRLRGRDPVDYLKGKYLMLNYDNMRIGTDEKFERGEKAFVSISVDDGGYAYFDKVYKKPPKSGDYLKTQIADFYDYESRSFVLNGEPTNDIQKYSVRITIPPHMSKYFINEDYAKRGEDVLFKMRGEVYVGIRVLDGECRLQDLYVKGTPFMKFLKQ